MHALYHTSMPVEIQNPPISRSHAAYEAACELLPGGVNSPVRAFKSVGGTPLFIARGKGAVITDIDGNNYIDYIGSWGALILGHADDRVVVAIDKAAAKGCSFGAPTEGETRLAELIAARFPSIQMLRLVSSGTEAVMSALRLARAFTGRDAIVKFQGCYHGHADALLVDAGSGPMTLGIPLSGGVPRATLENTIVLSYNDPDAVEEVFATAGKRIAAIVVEPVAGNMGLVAPAPGWLEQLRTLCTAHGALLIFDEVITGFRVAPGGAQQRFGVEPDVTCLGKIAGGGLPLAVYGGRREIMQRLAPLGDVYQAGTLSGNPLAVAAGIATLQALEDEGLYAALDARSERLASGLAAAAGECGISLQTPRIASMLGLFFSPRPIVNYATARSTDTQAYARFFYAMLNRGAYLPPSPFECLFVSLAHTDEQIEETVAAAREALGAMAGA